MFTGIIKEIGRVNFVLPGSLVIAAGAILRDVEAGGSVSVNGVCLTITSFNTDTFSADIMPETRARTNLGLLAVGDKVNLELPLTLAGPVGGHLVQGHVDATGKVSSVSEQGAAKLITCEAPPEVMRYVVEKGFIAVDGTSLTVAKRTGISFQVSLVGFTLEHTILGEKRGGDTVNLEVDIIAKYVEQLGQPGSGGITGGFLQEHGFV